MPTEAEIDSFLPSIRPLSRLALPAGEIECSICLESYVAEYPCRVFNLSRNNPNTATAKCQHIFGNVCLEKHIRSGGSRATKCPICRERWFESVVAESEDAELIAWDDDGDEEEGGVWGGQGYEYLNEEYDVVSVPLPRRIEVRVSVREVIDEEHDDAGLENLEDEDFAKQKIDLGKSNSGREQPEQAFLEPNDESDKEVPGSHMQELSNRGRVNQSIAFLERLLMTAEIDDPNARIDRDVEGLQRATARLWAGIESLSRQRDVEPQVQGQNTNGAAHEETQSIPVDMINFAAQRTVRA